MYIFNSYSTIYLTGATIVHQTFINTQNIVRGGQTNIARDQNIGYPEPYTGQTQPGASGKLEHFQTLRGYCTSYPQMSMFCALSHSYQHLLEKT